MTEHFHWPEHVHRLRTRREFLHACGGAAALIALGGALPARRGDRRLTFRTDPFTLGVGSGDPLPDGVVLWTRLIEDAVIRAAGSDARVPVRWELADDDGFRRVLRNGETLALPELGHSVHAEVEGLEPDRVYHYRFLAGGSASPTGRTRTAPAAGARNERLRFAFVSCQNYQHGYYTAYRHLSAESLDLVVHLGDYIYEGGSGRRSVRPHEGSELFSLEQYRRRYAQYRTDPDLQAAHAAFPWVVTWDDHEVDNNYAGKMPEDGQEHEAFLKRRAAAYQAYYEFMPLRRSAMPRGPGMLLYRQLGFGGLLSLNALDTRQHRDDQPCDDNWTTCAMRDDPSRTMLGDAQERWLLERLVDAPYRWNLLAQQVFMAPLEGRDDEDRRIYPMDMWDGYPAARARLLDAFASGRVANPVVLTGDIHSSWVADLHSGGPETPVVATELAGTSISTGGDGQEFPRGFGDVFAYNPHIRFCNGRRGYVSCEATPERLTADFRVVPWVTEPSAPLETRARFIVEAGRPGAVAEE